MHGNGIMPQRFLGKAFGISDSFGSLGPGVTVAVQRDALDAKSITALLELRRPVARADSSQIGEQGATARQVPQNFRHIFIKAHDGNGAGFLARTTDDVIFPIYILRFQKRQVGLRRAQVPRQLIERLAFGIGFAGDDGLMFLPCDGPLLLELDFRPAFLGQHRPRQPRHVHGKVVDAPQIDVG